MNWESASEICTGLMWDGKIAPHSARAMSFFPPYDEIVKHIQEGDCKEDIIAKVGVNPIQVAMDASKSLNGLSVANWLQILETTALSFDAGSKLEKLAIKAKKGEEVDWSRINFIISKAQSNKAGSFESLDDITAMEMPFKKTGMKCIDAHLGGLPEIGQVLVGAPPGTGKTTFMAGLAGCWVKEHPKENVAIFTLEMIASEMKMRFQEIHNLDRDELSRILVNDEAFLTPEDIVSKSAGIDNLGLVCVDFADLLIQGESSESAMAHIYRTFMLGAKHLGVPIVVLTQLNRNYNGGLPRPNHFRYTGLAEALAWMILMLHNPAQDWFTQDDDSAILPPVPGKAYIIAWKIRGGFRVHKDNSPGAIQIQYRGDMGWRTDHSGSWFSLKKEI